jgi:DNA polymerase III epsilon subunit-like protein
MKKAYYIVFDTETGGLDCTKNPILEIALVTLDINLKEIDRYETYVKPYDDLEITKGALNANGIKLRDVENNGITKKELIKNLIIYFKNAMPGSHPSLKPVVVGHNIPFDIGFMDELFKNEKTKFKDIISNVYIDTMADAKRSWPKISSINLSTCCEQAGIELINAHRAMPDVLATADLFRYFTKKLSQTTSSKFKDSESQDGKSRSKFQF